MFRRELNMVGADILRRLIYLRSLHGHVCIVFVRNQPIAEVQLVITQWLDENYLLVNTCDYELAFLYLEQK